MPSGEKLIRRTVHPGDARKASRARNRIKLSATVAAENFEFLEQMVSTGRTESIAEAVDMAIARLRKVENRARLEAATAKYFAELAPKARAEEEALERQLHLSARGVDFDREP
jgi:hypothetical protein